MKQLCRLKLFRINDVEYISKLSEANAEYISFRNLKNIISKNLNSIVIANLNINSLRKKLNLLPDQIKGNVDVLAISETNLDDSLPAGQFKICLLD